MREPLWIFQQRCRNKRFPLGLLKGYIKLLLQGLDYLHSECKIIHAGMLFYFYLPRPEVIFALC